MDNPIAGRRILINGIVQGVGFRPFVYGLAQKYQLNGWVRNTSAGVDIEVNGPLKSLEAFVKDLQELPPPLARIDHFQVESSPIDGYTERVPRLMVTLNS
jgi:hydrogenase maturation protein HypF